MARTQTLDGTTPVNRLGEFFASLDLGYKTAVRAPSQSIPAWVEEAFTTVPEFENCLAKLAESTSTTLTQVELRATIADLLERDARTFIPLMFCFRQVRFTNADLVQMLFDQAQLDDLDYFLQLERQDPEFSEVVRRTRKNRRWQSVVDGLSEDRQALADYKKAVSNYLDSPGDVWTRWKSRIELDETVRSRVASFVVDILGIDHLARIRAIEPVVRVNLRTLNVERVKHQVGDYAVARVKSALELAGFTELPVPEGKRDYESLSSIAPSLHRGSAHFVSEVAWKEDKRFDYALIGSGGIRFAIEVNYFTTSGSKIGEVVDHFIELYKDESRQFHFYYVTDGPGWFRYVRDVRRMLAEESVRSETAVESFPFLLNLSQLPSALVRAKASMAHVGSPGSRAGHS